MEHEFDAVVVGAGIAGLTAAAYLGKRALKTVLFEKSGRVGGLVGSFEQQGFVFDFGIRAFENSGIIFPMLRDLGIDLPSVKNGVTLGIEREFVSLTSRESLRDYRTLLVNAFPDCEGDIDRILTEITKVMGYMDVLYGIDNPIFMDLKNDRAYIFKTLLPWLLKYEINMRKAKKMDEPVVQTLLKFTKNRALVDMIAQHFFKDTPSFFALGYFCLYLDYNYPLGGTGVLAARMAEFAARNGVDIKTDTPIERIDVGGRRVFAADGTAYGYKKLVWAGDMKALYNAVDLNSVGDRRTRARIDKMRLAVSAHHGGDSVLTLFAGLDVDKSKFQNLFGPHSFYSPDKTGLSSLGGWQDIAKNAGLTAEQKKKALVEWLERYLALTTFEISIPALRDASLAPEGKTGVIISTLMDYELFIVIFEDGWYHEAKELCARSMLKMLSDALNTDLAGKTPVSECATPLTIARHNGSAHGAITGWAFGHGMPAENRFPKIQKSVQTPIPNVFQAGQWTFSPSGLPVCILTGRLAADAVSKNLGR
jgi:phytoene dehydrogenase-like protein